ncbi:MAG: FAD-dependent monooxygenase [Gammaproteobacteria bacterium]|nr:FAD-dependent monooxygenase [Gammaproteobacteria bacterium]
MNSNAFDVVIAGGGMIGAALALALSKQGKRVACVDPVSLEQVAESERSDSFDRRATACAMTTIHFFQNLSLWPSIQPKAAPIRQIDVSKQGQWGRTRLLASDVGLEAFGYVIPNREIGRSLASAWQGAASDDLHAFWGERVVSADVAINDVTVTLSDHRTLKSKLLVVADGGRSALREKLDIASRTTHAGQTALVCNIAFEREGDGRAFERFTTQGPLALLPLGDKQYNLVWCGNEHESARRTELSDAEFAEALNRAFGVALGKVVSVGRRICFPLDIVAADSIQANRVVVLGNAAQALHPVAGQGFNLGVRDVATLCDVLSGTPDEGSPEITEAYARARIVDREQMLALTTQLATSTTVGINSVVAAGFGLGLSGFGQFGLARKALALRASGFQSELPSLCLPPAASKERYVS